MPGDVINFFVHRSAARRYAAARPYFHPLVIARIVSVTGVLRFGRALDVACGTGQSAQALGEIAEVIEAIDISPEMIGQAKPNRRIHYQVAPAESLPFEDASFDLATVGSAFHWFDQASFLREARRVLKPGAWLIVYASSFSGEMVENGGFQNRTSDAYPKRFPAPPRHSLGLSEELAAPHDFKLCGTEKFMHNETMSTEQFTGYLLTQTNVIGAVEKGATPLAEAAAWIAEGVKLFSGGGRRTMKFGGMIWFLERKEVKV